MLKNTVVWRLVLQADVNLATALVPSDIACLASSPGRVSLTAVWTSREDRVLVLLILPSFPKMSVDHEE